MNKADDVLLGRAELEHAFTALGERLARRNVVALIDWTTVPQLANHRWSQSARWRRRNLSNKTVQRVAQRAGRIPAQVLLRLCLPRDLPVISRSTHRERIHQNAQIFDFALSNEDMAELDALDQTDGTDRALKCQWW